MKKKKGQTTPRFEGKKAKKRSVKKSREVVGPVEELLVSKNSNNMTKEMSVEEMKENVKNILDGVTAQNGFRKIFVESVVRKHVTDTTVADALVAELNSGFDGADGKFDTAAKSEAGEIDAEVADNEGLVADLFKSEGGTSESKNDGMK